MMTIKNGKIEAATIASSWTGLTVGSINQVGTTNVPSHSDNASDFIIDYEQVVGFGNFNFKMPGSLSISYNYNSNTLSAYWLQSTQSLSID
ncbi:MULTISPECIES: hypothetical protein [Chitinophagaceae]